MSVASPPKAPASAKSADLRVTVIGGEAAYDMFEVVAVEGADVKVRGPILLEVSEEVPLRVSRNGTSVDVRARVAAHTRGDGGAVTELVVVDGETELRRLLGS
jgi:hypothetical protein